MQSHHLLDFAIFCLRWAAILGIILFIHHITKPKD